MLLTFIGEAACVRSLLQLYEYGDYGMPIYRTIIGPYRYSLLGLGLVESTVDRRREIWIDLRIFD